jgi:hypothetical protein
LRSEPGTLSELQPSNETIQYEPKHTPGVGGHSKHLREARAEIDELNTPWLQLSASLDWRTDYDRLT